ncbi:hypothetical protein BU17DRAFT_69082 [Hysterangium stoloniferum]|nr:hypothetical protein BU17DRAFT_69082 [Hysterangium stoloniferum]
MLDMVWSVARSLSSYQATPPTITHNATIWTRNYGGHEILKGNALLNKGLIRWSGGPYLQEAQSLYGSSLVIVDAKGWGADEDGEIQATDVGPASNKRMGFIDKKEKYYKRAGTIISKCRELTEVTGAYVVTIIAYPETLGQGNSKFLLSDNLKIDPDTVEDIKTSMDHVGAIFLWVCCMYIQ